jgi:hypothetical protein
MEPNWKKPDITQRMTMKPCVDAVCGTASSVETDLRISALGHKETLPAPIKTVEGQSLYLMLTSCPYSRCPNSIESVNLQGPDAGNITDLCASKNVARVYIAVRNARAEQYK